MIQKFKDVYRGQTCLIIGNGPSLDFTPLEKLAVKYTTFAANKIYTSNVHKRFIPNFWACVDDLMLTDCIPWVIAHPDFNPEKFVPRSIPLPGSHGINPIIDVGFSKDPADVVYLGGTVTYVNLQIARYMGFTTALLVGVDHSYPKVTRDGKPGSRFIAKGSDMDHFAAEGEYFTPGKIYNRPELASVEKYFFPLAKREFDRVLNLTPESGERVFDKGNFKDWL